MSVCVRATGMRYKSGQGSCVSSCKTLFWDQQPVCKLRHVQPQLHKTLCGRVYPSMTDAAQRAVQVSRDLFVSFIASKPRTLQIYLHKVCPASSDIVSHGVSAAICVHGACMILA